MAFSQLRSSLIKVLRNSPESREPICDALELIETLQQQIEAKRNPDAGPPPPPATARRSRDGAPARPQQEYFVQSTHEGEFLTERRPSGSQPFRCPRATYAAAAGILAQSDAPLHFEEILERLNRAMGERQPDYRLRVCLRFWLTEKLIERFRTRYRPTDAATVTDDAGKRWEALKRPNDI